MTKQPAWERAGRPKPIPYKGALGLRKLPDDVTAEIGKRLS